MNLLLSIVVITSNVLGSFNDPFEFQGDYGPEVNPTREKVFELVVAKDPAHDLQHGPTLSELITPELIASLADKQTALANAGFSSEDLAKTLQFINRYGDQKVFYFFRNNPSDLMSMDKILRDKASREGKPFALSILSSTEPLIGSNAEELKKQLLNQLFIEENLQAAKPPSLLVQAIHSLPSDYLKQYLGDQADNADLATFTSPAGQLIFYWIYQSLNLHLIAQDASLIPQINKVKEIFAQTLGNPEVRAEMLREKLVQANASVLFTQESDTFVPEALTKDGLFLSAEKQNLLDGTLVFLKSIDWDENYEVIAIDGYEGALKGRLNVILAVNKASGKKFLLASAHGNSTRPEDGRLQIRLIKEKYDQLSKEPENAGLQLVIGIDANTKSDQDVEDLKAHLETLGLTATDVGPTTIKKRMVTVQHGKAGHYAVDEEDYLITLKPDHGGVFQLTNETVGFKPEKADINAPLPNVNNPSDHYPVGATLEEF